PGGTRLEDLRKCDIDIAWVLADQHREQSIESADRRGVVGTGETDIAPRVSRVHPVGVDRLDHFGRVRQKIRVTGECGELASVERDQSAEPRRADIETRISTRGSIPNANRSDQLSLLGVPAPLLEWLGVPSIPARTVIAACLPRVDHADKARARIATMFEEVVEPCRGGVMQMLDIKSTFGQHAQCVAIHRWLRDV